MKHRRLHQRKLRPDSNIDRLTIFVMPTRNYTDRLRPGTQLSGKSKNDRG